MSFADDESDEEDGGVGHRRERPGVAARACIITVHIQEQ